MFVVLMNTYCKRMRDKQSLAQLKDDLLSELATERDIPIDAFEISKILNQPFRVTFGILKEFEKLNFYHDIKTSDRIIPVISNEGYFFRFVEGGFMASYASQRRAHTWYTIKTVAVVSNAIIIISIMWFTYLKQIDVNTLQSERRADNRKMEKLQKENDLLKKENLKKIK